MKKIGIFGTSGMAREVADIAIANNFSPLFVAKNKKEVSDSDFLNDVICETEVERYSDINYVIGIGNNFIRQKIVNYFKKKLEFTNLFHPNVTFGHGQKNNIDACKGSILCAGLNLTNNILSGNFCIFNRQVTIGHDVTLGDYVNISPGSIISGNVEIGDFCYIGAGSIINQGNREKRLTIGNNTIIGSGAVVINSCEANSTYVGNPARKIK